MSAPVLPAGVGRGWRATWRRVGERWVIDARRGCVMCGRDYRACVCDGGRTRDDNDNAALDRETETM